MISLRKLIDVLEKISSNIKDINVVAESVEHSHAEYATSNHTHYPSHVHDNLSNLNAIDQKLGTGDNPRFGGQQALALDYAAVNNGKVLGVQAGSLSWVEGGGGSTSVNAGMAIFSDTVGGAFTAGAWRVRTLNLHEGDNSFATLANNTVTVTAAGTYLVHVEAGAFAVDWHQAALLVNSITYYGSSMAAYNQFNGHSNSSLFITNQLEQNDTIQLLHRCQQSYIHGLGSYPVPWMTNRKYAHLVLMRVS